MIVKKGLILLPLFFCLGNAYALGCVEPVKFEDTSEYALYEAIEAKSNSIDETISKFARNSELGVSIFRFREFVSNEEYKKFNDIEKLRQKWVEGESIILQHLLLNFLILEEKYIKISKHTDFLEEILSKNRRNCWIGDDEYYSWALEYKLKVVKAYPELPDIQETIFFLRKLLWHSGEDEVLQSYLKLLRLGGLGMAKEELSFWNGRNSSEAFCSGVAHCIQQIGNEIERAKDENSESIEESKNRLKCELMYVQKDGSSVKVDLC